MNARERFYRVMHFQPVDRVPFWDWFWSETVDRWHKEGLPEDLTVYEFFQFDKLGVIPIYLGMLPGFERQIIEETERYRIIIDETGIKKKVFKEKLETWHMPQFLDFPVKCRKDFEAIKRRYDSKSVERYPIQWDELVSSWKNRDYPLSLGIGNKNFGFFGSLREWMGIERLLVTFYDDPMLIHEMMDFVLEFLLDTIHRSIEDVDIDRVDLWEDMGYKAGPLISPAMFREFMLPRYKSLTAFIRDHGIDVIFVDSDGNVNELIPLWLEGGVNGFLPIEVRAGMDPCVLRQKYGKDILLIGGVDKGVLTKDKKAIEEEFTSKIQPLISKGGYIPAIDHAVPPDVSFENYAYYRHLVAELAS